MASSEQGTASSDAPPKAQWMEGKWGLRFLIPGMKSPGRLNKFDVEAMMDQIKPLSETASWVQLNVTQGANGSYYTTPMPILSEHVCKEAVPERDLFSEMLDALLDAGFKVIVYYASEGPTTKQDGKQPSPPGAVEKWKELCESRGMTPEEAVAKLLVQHLAQRFGEKISGWWFDHAKYGNIELLAEAALSGNPHAALTFNYVEEGRKFNKDGSRKMMRGVKHEHYTAGHPVPCTHHLPSWDGNARMISDIEQNGAYFDGSLGHMFVPMQALWYAGDPCFTDEKIVDWTLRVVKAGGAITWASALEQGVTLPETQLHQLKAINEAVAKYRTEEGLNDEQDSVSAEL